MSVEGLSAEIKACRICVEHPTSAALPHEPNPVCVMSEKARICICGQAPGIRVHKSGKPFADPSGDRLRDWMGIDAADFYDADKLAIVPMGFCFPGYDKNAGDLPPRKECRLHWHDRVFSQMPQIELILTIGQYAQAYHLGAARKSNMTQTVQAWRDYIHQTPAILPLPHPSWRNSGWLKRNPWFEEEVLPVLKERVKGLL